MSSRRFNQASLNQFPGIQEMERRAIERRSIVYDIDEETARQRYASRRVDPRPVEEFPSLEEFQRRAMERRSLANSIDEQVIGSGNTNPVNPLPSQTRPRADATGAVETTRQTSLTVNAPRHDRMLQQAVAVASALNRAQQSHNNRLEQVSATLGRAQQLHSTAAGLRVQINTTNNQPTRRRATRATMEAFNNFNNRVRANPELLLQPQTFARNGTVNPSIHPQFRSKIVCRIYCSHCTSALCNRGMKAILLGNTKVELYSTDTPPAGVQLVFGDYTTVNCGCRIRDGACLCCGNVVGYHVTQPCEVCLEACNNGHFWMFHADGVNSTERKDTTGTKSLRWAMLGSAEEDGDDGMEVSLEGSDFDGMLCR